MNFHSTIHLFEVSSLDQINDIYSYFDSNDESVDSLIRALINEEKDDEALMKLSENVLQKDEDVAKVQNYIAIEFEGDYDVLESLEGTTNYQLKVALSQKYVSETNIKDTIKTLNERSFTDNSLIFALLHRVN